MNLFKGICLLMYMFICSTVLMVSEWGLILYIYIAYFYNCCGVLKIAMDVISFYYYSISWMVYDLPS